MLVQTVLLIRRFSVITRSWKREKRLMKEIISGIHHGLCLLVIIDYILILIRIDLIILILLFNLVILAFRCLSALFLLITSLTSASLLSKHISQKCISSVLLSLLSLFRSLFVSLCWRFRCLAPFRTFFGFFLFLRFDRGLRKLNGLSYLLVLILLSCELGIFEISLKFRLMC